MVKRKPGRVPSNSENFIQDGIKKIEEDLEVYLKMPNSPGEEREERLKLRNAMSAAQNRIDAKIIEIFREWNVKTIIFKSIRKHANKKNKAAIY